RLRATLEVIDLDVEPLLLEVAEAIGQRQRQVIECRRATDPEPHVYLLRLVVGPPRRGHRQHRPGRQRQYPPPRHVPPPLKLVTPLWRWGLAGKAASDVRSG